jgi:hypothetical protein
MDHDFSRLGWRHLVPMGCVFLAIYAAVAVANFFIDPFQLIRKSEIYAFAPEFQRSTNAGRIRTEPPFDAAVVGTSHIGNFDPAVIENVFGTRAKVFSIFGGSIREIVLTVTFLLERRPAIKFVFLEASIWNVCNDGWHSAWPFPVKLYRDNPLGIAQYLLSGDTLRLSAKQLLYRLNVYRTYNAGFSRLEPKVHRWYEEHRGEFGDPYYMKLEEFPYSASPIAGQQIEAEVLQYPNTTFLIFNPPLLQQLLMHQARLGNLEVWIRAQEMFAAKLSPALNIKYFDFHAATEIEGDCRRFRDVAHFDPDTGDQLVRWMHDGTFERTAASNPSISAATMDILRQPYGCPPHGGGT